MFVDGDPSQDRIMDFELGQDAIDLSRWGVTSFDQLDIAERTNNAGVFQGDLLISFNGEGVIIEGMTAVNIPSLNGARFIFANPTTIDPNRWAGATIDGTIANDLINGAFRDVDGQGISGGGQIIFGGLGNETVFDGAGNDQIFGGDGDERFYNGGGADTIDGGAGRDELSFAYANGGVLFNMLDQTANVGQALGDRATTIERLHGSDFSDVLFGGALATLYGRAGDDYIRDGVGAQQLFGGTGLDIFAFEGGDRKADQIMDFVIGQDKIDISAWAVSSFSQLAITSRQTVSGNGTVNNDVLITFGREVIELDGLTAAGRGNLTAASFVQTAPAVFLAQRQAQQLAEGWPQALDFNARTAPAAAQAFAPAVSVSVAATMALASSMDSSDSMAFVAIPAAALRFGSYAALSSGITGDALAGGPTGNGLATPDGSGGVLVDPSTTVTAFLSATQLAALDDNHFSFY